VRESGNGGHLLLRELHGQCEVYVHRIAFLLGRHLPVGGCVVVGRVVVQPF